jgi:uncharacterized phage infection (PIP) family protein YhgE
MLTWFDNLRLGRKLQLLMAAVLVLTVVVGGLAVVQLGHIGASVGEVAHTALPRARQVAALRAELLSFRTTQYAHMLSDDETEQAGFKQRIQQIAGQVAQTRQRIEPLLSDTTQRSAYDLRPAVDPVPAGQREGADAHRRLRRQGPGGRLRQDLRGDERQPGRHPEGQRRGGGRAGPGHGIGRRQHPHRHPGHGGGRPGPGHAAGLVPVAAHRGLAGRGLAQRPRGGQGRPDRPHSAGGHDEVGALLTSLGEMQTGLSSLVHTVRSGVDSVATASSEIATGNMDLSSRTEQQAASLQRTASAVQQLASNLHQSTDVARRPSRWPATPPRWPSAAAAWCAMW